MWAVLLALVVGAMCDDPCNDCAVVVARIKQMGSLENPEVASQLKDLCIGSESNTTFCHEIITSNSPNASDWLSNKTAEQFCAASLACASEGDLIFHSAGLADQTLTQVGAQADQKPQAYGGLAWDKHDFGVTSNQGGNVKVEVNLAAPMTGGGGGDSGDDDDGDDVVEMVKLLTPEDPVNPIELMSMMKELMVSLKPQEPEPMNLKQILQDFKTKLKEETLAQQHLIQQQSAQPAPAMSQPAPAAPQAYAYPGFNITELVLALKDSGANYIPVPIPAPATTPDMVINALLPAQAPVQPSFDVGSFMKEMREVVASNKPPPAPPAGLDPQLLDLVKNTMQMVRDMKTHSEVAAAQAAEHRAAFNNQQSLPSPPPSPAPSPPAPVIPQIFMPPPAPPALNTPAATGGADGIKSAMQDIIRAHSQPPALPVLPPPAAADPEIQQLKELLRAQELTARMPIILPPPVVIPKTMEVSAASMLPPPPPPPPAVPAEMDMEDFKAAIAAMMPKPQRIPAPPSISVVHEHASTQNCCPAPLAQDSRPDDERCPKINGVARPRCKRTKPPQVPSASNSCKRPPCSNVDEDGDVIVTPPSSWPGSLPEAVMAADSFDPKKILKILCPGGLCPGQKDIDPKMNPRKFLTENLL
eukprot:c32939_g1_i1.p1 GENE.c32939_g1_i1~~c32939_g1_i1.p1  ORF type:complete len:643 (-),score=134.67 c32939_g1_i1:129-2057(-)